MTTANRVTAMTMEKLRLTGEEAKREGMERAWANTPYADSESYYWHVRNFAMQNFRFISDDCRATYTGSINPLAIGGIMNRLANEGKISKTGRSRPSTRTIAHRRDQAEWQSNICRRKFFGFRNGR